MREEVTKAGTRKESLLRSGSFFKVLSIGFGAWFFPAIMGCSMGQDLLQQQGESHG